jgi:transposase
LPWKTSDLFQQREDFVKRATRGDECFSSLCRSFEISRQTGYKWLSRYRNADIAHESLREVLKNGSRRPHHSPGQVSPDLEAQVLNARAQHRWGAQRLSVALRREGISVGHSTVNKILKEHGQLLREDPSAAAWVTQVFLADDPLPKIATDLPGVSGLEVLAEHLRAGRLRDRKKAMAVLARLKGIPIHTVAECLNLTPHTVIRYDHNLARGGLEAVFPKRRSRVNDEGHRGPVIALLHSPPSSFGLNRTTWRMEDLHRVLGETGTRVSEHRIRRILKSGGFRWRRAKIVLTSNDPQYETKLQAIKSILSELRPDEAFFSIDEYGPFAIKQKGGAKRVGPGEEYAVQQWQKSKGWMILTAALELSRNQVTHFYSRHKNTEEMIKMADLLRREYRDCRSIYLSWDAASWHVSKKLTAYLEKANEESPAAGYPLVKTAPLPACAQFLNVIESVFSGMSRAIIHNSNYASVDAAKDAIDRYFRERNAYFSANPRRAGHKIWGQERVPSNFTEGQNCKDPSYR